VTLLEAVAPVEGTPDRLVLQVKEAPASVLAPYVGRTPSGHEGRRVVSGQRDFALEQREARGFVGVEPAWPQAAQCLRRGIDIACLAIRFGGAQPIVVALVGACRRQVHERLRGVFQIALPVQELRVRSRRNLGLIARAQRDAAGQQAAEGQQTDKNRT